MIYNLPLIPVYDKIGIDIVYGKDIPIMILKIVNKNPNGTHMIIANVVRYVGMSVILPS